jgi:5-methylcytosine-specific restriction enzyme subunit McrC
MLLHPQTGGSVNEAMTVQGHRMWFRTVDLMADPQEFEESTKELGELWCEAC